MINMTSELNDVCEELLKEEIKNELIEILMEKVKENIQNELRKYQDIPNKNLRRHRNN
jgi:hypothetical protein